MADPTVALTCDRYFLDWLTRHKVSLVGSTYQTSRLLLFGRKDDRLGLFERLFDRAMGLFVEDDQAFWLATRYQVWRFVNNLAPGQTHDGADRLYVPRQCHVTGDVDLHDLVVDAQDQVQFVATTFNAVATLSPTHSLRPVWRPPFISQNFAEDRCHLNGLALRDGQARYVTLVGSSDVVDGWREFRANGGLVMDMTTNDVIASGLSMPHSPRWYLNRLWLLNSGTGEFGFIDLDQGRFEPVAFCPGYARGLCFVGDDAVIGLSKPRDASFTGLPLDERLAAKHAEARCGLLVVNLHDGQVHHWVRFEGIISELYDLQVLPGVCRPMAYGFRNDEIARHITLD